MKKAEHMPDFMHGHRAWNLVASTRTHVVKQRDLSRVCAYQCVTTGGAFVRVSLDADVHPAVGLRTRFGSGLYRSAQSPAGEGRDGSQQPIAHDLQDLGLYRAAMLIDGLDIE